MSDTVSDPGSPAEPTPKRRRAKKKERRYKPVPARFRKSRFSQWLRVHLCARGLDIGAGAAELGVARPTFNRWCAGGEITTENLERLIRWAVGARSALTPEDLRAWRYEPALPAHEILKH